MQIPIRGVPPRIDNGWHDGDVYAYSKGKEGHYVEFKVVSGDLQHREGHEALMALAVNNPEAIGFQIEEDSGRMFLSFAPRVVSGVSYRLGVVPLMVQRFVEEATERRLFDEHVNVAGYAVEMSIVGREIDSNKVMGMADDGELDGLTDSEFDDLIGSMYKMLDGEVSVVRILLRISPQGCSEKLFHGGVMEVINV